MLFLKYRLTHKRCKCAGGVENIHNELMSNVAGMLGNSSHLTVIYLVKSQDFDMK